MKVFVRIKLQYTNNKDNNNDLKILIIVAYWEYENKGQ